MMIQPIEYLSTLPAISVEDNTTSDNLMSLSHPLCHFTAFRSILLITAYGGKRHHLHLHYSRPIRCPYSPSIRHRYPPFLGQRATNANDLVVSIVHAPPPPPHSSILLDQQRRIGNLSRSEQPAIQRPLPQRPRPKHGARRRGPKGCKGGVGACYRG